MARAAEGSRDRPFAVEVAAAAASVAAARSRAAKSRSARRTATSAPRARTVATPDSRDAPWSNVAAASRASALASSGARPLRCASWKAATSTTPSADVAAARPPARRALRAARAAAAEDAAAWMSRRSRASVRFAVGVAADACCVTTNGKPPLSSATSAPSLAARSPSTSVLELEEPSSSFASSSNAKKVSSPSSASGAVTSEGTCTRSRCFPPHAVAAPAADAAGRRPPAIGNERLVRAASGNLGSAQRAASRGVPKTPPRSGTATMSGGVNRRDAHRLANEGGMPPAPAARSRRKGCTRLSSRPMAPSCANTAAMRAPTPRSSTLGAASATRLEEASTRSVLMSVPRRVACSGGTKRSSAQPHLCGSSVGSTRRGVEPVSSSKSVGNPCAESRAKKFPPAVSSHSPTFRKPATPVTSFGSCCVNECVNPASFPSGPSPVTPSSRHERSSIRSNALCGGRSGYTNGHAAVDAPAFCCFESIFVASRLVASSSRIVFGTGAASGCPTATRSSTRDRR